jgi:hypothetical protein
VNSRVKVHSSTLKTWPQRLLSESTLSATTTARLSRIRTISNWSNSSPARVSDSKMTRNRVARQPDAGRP